MLAFALATSLALSVPLQPVPGNGSQDLTSLSLEQLMQMEVTSVSRREESVAGAAAAVYVITQEDLRRSGVSSIPEALRMVPGIEVARINSSQWAISARGFLGRFANKMLVMIDGRTVYTTLFSGVFWDVQDLVLEDVERIEVIRGPGATMWGANAVNGVINIITKRAADTQGSLFFAQVGDEDRFTGGYRYGGSMGEDAHYRFYGKYLDRDGAHRADDEWDQARGGFRFDWGAPEADDRFTVQGDFYDGSAALATPVPLPSAPYSTVVLDDTDSSGGNLQGTWVRRLSETSELSLAARLDHFDLQTVVADDERLTMEIDLQHGFQASPNQRILWGLGYRRVESEFDGSFALSLREEERNDDLLSAFVQDEIALDDAERWRLVLGSKFEENDYTGFEIQPSVRLAFRPDEHKTWWAAVSRAVRTPSQVEDDAIIRSSVFPGTFPFTNIVEVRGSGDVEAEELTAYELGFRAQPTESLSFDISTFVNDYDNLTTMELGAPEIDPINFVVVLPATFDNERSGQTYGVELAADWRVREDWRLRAAYSLVKIDVDLDAGSADLNQQGLDVEGESPDHQFSVRSYYDIAPDVELDVGVAYVDDIEVFGIDGYWRTDVRLGWRPRPSLEFVVGVQNAFDSHHAEYGSDFFTTPFEIERSAYALVRWRP